MSDGGDAAQAAVQELPSWKETYHGGSPEAERQEFELLARRMMDAQRKARKAAGTLSVDRAFHVKAIAAMAGASIRFADDMPDDLRVGFAKPGAEYPAEVRFSNASPAAKSDEEKDLRGLAVRIAVSPEEQHDLLATNFPVPHARDAHQFVHFAHAVSGGRLSKAAGLVRLVFLLGPREVRRMIKNVREALRTCDSLALETYWSRGALRWGDQAVRYFFRPAEGAPTVSGTFEGPGRLAAEFAARQAAGPITFELCLQRFVEEDRTPIEDAATAWDERVSPPVAVATLTLPTRDLSLPDAEQERARLEAAGFNPWNTTEEFRPLGHLNRARKAVYDASLAHRRAQRWQPDPPALQNRVFGSGARWLLRWINRRRPWHRLPLLVSLLNLDALRHDLRRWNLIDAEPREAPPATRPVPADATAEERIWRTHDGRANDLSDPAMGAVGAAFGRNMPLADEAFDDPNAVTVARELMDRKSFIPARSLNILAAAWIQFQVHDWVAHARRKLGEDDLIVKIPDRYPDWVSAPNAAPAREMRIAGNIPHPQAKDPWVFANEVSHWWDGSEVYGSDHENANSLRDGARLLLDKGYLPEDKSGMELTGFNESWWLGLSSLHTLFAREHNVLCDELRKAYAGWSDDRIYQTARLIVSALIAKIHTVEWTPAILGTEALNIGMKTNWFGPPSGDWLTKLGIWLTDTHALKGIPKTLPDHHSAPYALTEEFATVYRLHPLIPDDYLFFDYSTGREADCFGGKDGPRHGRAGFLEIQGADTDECLRTLGLENTLYSLGIAHPGAITLHNSPKAFSRFQRRDEIVDLSVVDIMRTRMRRVPRYNAFRRYLRMPEVRRWEDATANPETNRLLKEIYGGVDRIDTVVGLLGENPPAGFGFSDTAFRIFILMASRRLQSDRFLTVDFRPEIYSPLGMDWIETNDFTSLLLRHCPELAPVLPRGKSAFAPWRSVS